VLFPDPPRLVVWDTSGWHLEVNVKFKTGYAAKNIAALQFQAIPENIIIQIPHSFL